MKPLRTLFAQALLFLGIAAAAAAAQAATTLSVSPTAVSSGSSVTATWGGIPAPKSTDWLGLYLPGAANTAYLAWRYTNGAASGSLPFTIPAGIAAGTYELRLLINGYTLLATSNRFLVNPALIIGTVTVGASPLAGVSFAATNPGAGGCSASNGAGQYSCTLPSGWSGTITPALVGYGFAPASRSYSNAIGTQGAQDYAASASSVSVSPASVAVGASVTAGWSDNSVPTATDWLGLFATGAPDQAHLSWRYTSGTASGSVPFAIPASTAAGTYELRYFSNDGYTRLATSNGFTVNAYQISGMVSAGASPLAGVVFAASSGASCTPSNAAGQYACSVPPGWSGSVTPALAGYGFSPASRSYSAIAADQTAQDYAASAQSTAGELHFIHVDHLNTPRLVADATGTTVWRWDQQEPFGNNPADENPSGLGAFDLPLRLPGQYFDKETNLHYNYSRHYDPSIGRYEESDLIGLLGGVNTYTYVAGSPLHASDELGLFYGEEAAYVLRAPVAGPAAAVAGLFLGGVAIGTAIYNAYGEQIQDALEKLCRPDKSPDHRGRIQAQGNITGPDVNVSSAWAQKQPLTKAEGFAHLHRTVIQIPPRQLPRFTNAIGKAASFIQSTSMQTAPRDWSFYQDWKQSGRRGAERIDIQIFNGEAF